MWPISCDMHSTKFLSNTEAEIEGISQRNAFILCFTISVPKLIITAPSYRANIRLTLYPIWLVDYTNQQQRSSTVSTICSNQLHSQKKGVKHSTVAAGKSLSAAPGCILTINQLVATHLTNEHTCRRLMQSLITVKYFSLIIPPNANLNFGVASDLQASEELLGVQRTAAVLMFHSRKWHNDEDRSRI